MTQYPLISHRMPDDALAWTPSGPLSVARYLCDVHAVADWLPATPWVINLCEDRYHFAVLFGACAVTSRVSLQPASQSAQTLEQLMLAYPGAQAVSDRQVNTTAAALTLPVLGRGDALASRPMPMIPADRTVAILFTSGSTGQPQPHGKTWGKLVANGQAEATALGLDGQPHVLVGTVPAQHSYGFESTFLLAMHGGCAFWRGKPFYPQDLAEALQSVPQPRMVVTTPYHLASIMASDVRLPPVDRWLSATAPLAQELAAKVEAVSAAPVHEIYGSTESSQLATRRTCLDQAWTLMPGVSLEQEGDATWACGGHVEGRVPLSDIIGLLAGGRFELHGRHADMINLAGKRTSLAYLNHQLCSIDGVRDGAFYLPQEDSEDRIGRLVAFVVAPEGDRSAIVAALRQRVDPIFLPRPLVHVEELPRNSTGKLTREVLQRLYEERVLARERNAG